MQIIRFLAGSSLLDVGVKVRVEIARLLAGSSLLGGRYLSLLR